MYNVCDGKGRPIYAFDKATSCGRFYKTEFCNHPFCHDERLKLARGDTYALKKQRLFNTTGIYSRVTPINYDNINGRIIIKKELKEATYKPEIIHINWKDKDAIIYMKKDNSIFSPKQQKPLMRSKINHLLPPMAMSFSFLLQSIYLSLNWQAKYMKRKIIHHINYPKEILSLSNFFYISLLLLALYTPFTRGEERMTPNFIYELIDDEILLNNQYLFTAKKFVPCDLKIAEKTLDNILTSYHETCETDFRWKGVTNGEAVEAYDKNFILMKGHYNRLEAETICKTLGTNLIEIRNETDKHQLSIFMGKHLISTAYAGLQVYDPIREAVYQSDGSIATDKMFSSVKYYWGDDKYEHEWDDVLEYEQAEVTSGGSFYYKNVGNDLELWINYEKIREQIPDSIIEHWQLGVATENRVICNNRNVDQNIKSIIDTDYPIWRTSCKQNLETIKKMTKNAKKKIEAIMPKNLPARKDFLIPFLRMDEQTSKKNGHAHNHQEKSSPSLLMNANSEWKKMIEGDKLSTDEQCKLMNDDRQKRASLTVWGIVFLVYEAINFFIRLIPIINSFTGGSEDKITNEDNTIISSLDDITYSTLQMMNNYKNRDKHLNISYTMANEQKLKNAANVIFDYTDKGYDKIMDLPYVDNFKPKNTIEFMDLNQFNQIIQHVSNEFGQELVRDISQAISYVANTGNSFIVATAIPFKSEAAENELYKIHHVPTMINNSQFQPISTAKYMAVSKHGDRYTPLDEMEAYQCSEDKVCSSNSPTYQDTNKNCGFSNFWINDDETCKFIETNITRPYFITIGNKTYYKTGDKSAELEIDCTADLLNRPGEENKENVTGYNYLELPFSCHASYQSMTMRPAQRSLKLPRIHLTPQIKIPGKNNGGSPLDINDIMDNVNSSIDPTINFIMYTFAATTVLIIIVSTICKKSILQLIFKPKKDLNCCPLKQQSNDKSNNGSYKQSNYQDIILPINPAYQDIESTPIIRAQNQLEQILNLNKNTSIFNNTLQKQIDILGKEAGILEPRENQNFQQLKSTQEDTDTKTRLSKKKADPNHIHI